MARTRIREGQAVDIEFVSEAELASTGAVDGVSGAEKAGIRDTGEYYSGTTVEAGLQELGPLRAPVESFETASGGSITLKRSDTEVLSGDVIGKVDFQAKDANAQGGVYESVASIEVQSSEEFSGAATAGTKMIFRTNAAGTETPNDNMVLNGEDLTIEGFASPRTLDMELLVSAPTAKQGRFYFNSAESKFYGCHDGINWKLIGGGGVAGSGYKHTQSSSSAVWTIVHNLNYKYVNIECYDSSDNVIIPESIVATDANTLTVTFASSRTGTAVISAAAAVATAGFLHTQAVAATSWTVIHGLNDSNPIVQVYDASGNVILPDSIVINSATQLTIGFLIAQDGKARVLAMGTAEVTVAKTIAESENNVGVTVDGVLLKDSTVLGGMLVPGQTVNLGWFRSAGTVTIKGSDGNDLSASNPGFVCIRSAVTSGKYVVIPVTSNQTFNDDDHASSHLTNWTFGVTSGVAWNTFMPIFIGAWNKDDTSAGLVFGITRCSIDMGGEAANSFGDKDTPAVTQAQESVFLIGNITPADYVGKPMAIVGATRMKKDDTGNDWTIADSLTSNRSGIGQEATDWVCSLSYTMPAGQNGATSGKHFSNNGGTAPVFTTELSIYTVSKTGDVQFFNHFYSGAPGGAGGVNLQLHLPYISAPVTANIHMNTGNGVIGMTAGAVNVALVPNIPASSQVAYVYRADNMSTCLNLNLGESGDSFMLTTFYKAF